MDKKILGIKIGTYLTVLLALVCAVVFWLYVKIASYDDVTSVVSEIARYLK
jgi:hypothetical protein